MTEYQSRHSGLQYPIQKTPPGIWLVVGATAFADHDERKQEVGPLHSLDIHIDRDDPNFEFLSTADLGGMTPAFITENGGTFRGPRAVVDAYNAPFRRTNRMRLRRATEARSIETLMGPHYEAARLVAIWRREHREAA